MAAAPKLTGPVAASVTSSSATLKGTVNPEGVATSWRFLWGTADCSVKPNPCKFTKKEPAGAGTSPVPIEFQLTSLLPGTVYHFLLEAESSGGKAASTDRAFATPGAPSEGLPDERAYEQSSPPDKDGGDALGELGLVKAAVGGNGITFGNSFGIPGGKGAQALPSYLALRGEGEAGWSTQGLLPPPEFGERAQLQGWLPDFSKTYSSATRLGNPRTNALVEQSTSGGPPTIISPYTPKAEYSYVGANSDASVVFFESEAQLRTKETGGTLITGAVQGRPNVYAWNRATGELSLAGALNSGKAPPKGTLAGPYDWSRGISANSLGNGGSASGYYVQGAHAITASGGLFFTEVGTGQLYLRVNPTQPQSAMAGETCLEAAKACTIHVSESKRSVPDSAGPQPAAFQAASADGSKAFFTSPEKLTDESNTGPEQPEAAISRGSSSIPTIEKEALVKTHAIGVAVDSSHVYWADPAKGTIGRSDLDGGNSEDLIVVPPGECEVEVEVEPEVFEVEKVEVPSTPRYVAVDEVAKYLYWTNSGLRDEDGKPIDGGGTIGRAELDGAGNLVPASVEPAFICGEVEPAPETRIPAISNPQGIAVNAKNIYWTNAGFKQRIARAEISGGGVEPEFLKPFAPNGIPYGVALSATHVYYSFEEQGPHTGYLEQATLEGEEPQVLFIGKEGIRGLALNSTHLYWATQGEEAIGRVPLSDFKTGSCEFIPTCEKEFIKPTGKLNGLAADDAHLYWSINGEAPTNAGNDLYRYEPGPGPGTLEDLSYDAADVNGAEVQGVLGASADGSHIYFAANGDLDGAGEATKGNCHMPQPHGALSLTSGSCDVYLWNEGAVSFVGRVRGADAIDWTGTPRDVFSSFAPKSAFVSKDGQTLLFRSEEKLSGYENEGAPELYRFHAGDTLLRCVSCPSLGEAAGKAFTLESIRFPGISPLLVSATMVESRNLSADGNRVFFETAEALVLGDTNGQAKCPGTSTAPACQDVYEWEAPGSGNCTTSGPAYSALNEGCLYLISTGKSPYPSFFADASQSGDDVFFFTRQGLVGQDKDELQDVYDARVGGGIPAQNRVLPPPCESSEACHGLYDEPPGEASPPSAGFVGPANPAPKHKKATKPKKHPKNKHKKKASKRRAGSGRRAGR